MRFQNWLVDEDTTLAKAIGPGIVADGAGMADQSAITPPMQLVARRLHHKTIGTVGAQVECDLVRRAGQVEANVLPKRHWMER